MEISRHDNKRKSIDSDCLEDDADDDDNAENVDIFEPS